MKKKSKVMYPLITIRNYNDNIHIGCQWSLKIQWSDNQYDCNYFSAKTKTLILREFHREMKRKYKCLVQDIIWTKEKLEREKNNLNEFSKIYNKKEFPITYQIDEPTVYEKSCKCSAVQHFAQSCVAWNK